MYSLNYRFCAAVQNTSLTNKLSATDARDQIQYDAKLKNTHRAEITYTIPQKDQKERTENDTKPYQQPPHSKKKRKEIRDIPPNNQPYFWKYIQSILLKTYNSVSRIFVKNNSLCANKNSGRYCPALHTTKQKQTTKKNV